VDGAPIHQAEECSMTIFWCVWSVFWGWTMLRLRDRHPALRTYYTVIGYFQFAAAGLFSALWVLGV
jgi:hypothetical protein